MPVEEFSPPAEQSEIELRPKEPRIANFKRKLLAVLIGVSATFLLPPLEAHAAGPPVQPDPAKPDVGLAIGTFDITAPPPFPMRMPIDDYVLAGITQGPESSTLEGESCKYPVGATHTEKYNNQESIDISVLENTPIINALADDKNLQVTVAYAGDAADATNVFIDDELLPNYGKLVALKVTTAAGEVYEIIYAHLSKIAVSTGDTVNLGQELGRSGHSGTKKSHVHFDVRKQLADGSFKTVPIRTMFPWLSGDVQHTCINGQNYDAILLGPKLVGAVQEVAEELRESTLETIQKNFTRIFMGPSPVSKLKPLNELHSSATYRRQSFS